MSPAWNILSKKITGSKRDPAARRKPFCGVLLSFSSGGIVDKTMQNEYNSAKRERKTGRRKMEKLNRKMSVRMGTGAPDAAVSPQFL